MAGLTLWALERRRRMALAAQLGPRAEALAGDLGRRSRRRRRVLHVAALGCLVLAVLRPVLGVAASTVTPRGVDLVVCLDVSLSMLARDLQPSRLAAAKQEIAVLSERARGDRLGLVVFAGQARLLVPLTQDAESYVGLLEQADELSVGAGGTDLGAALAAALAALAGASGDHEAVLLVTDGEDHEGQGLRVAQTCRDRGVVVHCVGFGSTLGSKIAVPGPAGETWLQDEQGQDVVTALDPQSLARVAEVTGGSFSLASPTSPTLVDLYERRILPIARKAFDAEQRSGRASWFQVPLLLAFLLWLWELATGVRTRHATALAPGPTGTPPPLRA